VVRVTGIVSLFEGDGTGTPLVRVLLGGGMPSAEAFADFFFDVGPVVKEICPSGPILVLNWLGPSSAKSIAGVDRSSTGGLGGGSGGCPIKAEGRGTESLIFSHFSW